MTEPIASLSLEDFTEPATPAPEPIVLPDAEVPEANGVVEVTGQKIDVGPLLAAERKRVREATEAKVRAEYEPIKRQADAVSRLEAELQSLKQQIQPKVVEPAEPEVSDADAEACARHYQLYDADGKLAVEVGKKIVAERRAEARDIADQSALRVMKPIQETEEKRAAHDNFMRIAATKDSEGQYVFQDPSTHGALLEAWNALPDNLRSMAEVGDIVVKTALGDLALKGKGARTKAAVPAIEREPVLSEASGTRGAGPYTMSPLEKKLADESNMSHKDFEARAKTYQPGQPNSLE